MRNQFKEFVTQNTEADMGAEINGFFLNRKVEIISVNYCMSSDGVARGALVQYRDTTQSNSCTYALLDEFLPKGDERDGKRETHSTN